MGVGDRAMESHGGDASIPMVGYSLVAREGSCSPLLLFGGRNVDGGLLNGVWAVALTGEASLLPPAGLVPSPREFHTAHVLGGLMVSILGHVADTGSADDDLPVFDTVRDVWSAVPSVGAPPHFPRCHHTSCVDEATSTVFVLGGLPCDAGNASFHQLQLQASRGVWRAVESGPGVPRVWGHAAAVSGRGLYVSGGTHPEEGGEGEGEGEGTAGSFGLLRYDLDAGAWAEVAAGTAVATAGYDGAEASGGKLSFERGDTLRVAERHSRGWSKGRVLARGGGGSASSSGWFPTSYVEEVCPDARALHVMVAASGEEGSDGESQGDSGETALLAAASQAALLHKSIKIRDTDVEQVMFVLEQISTQAQWCAVRAAYARDYPRAGGANLAAELAEVLDTRSVDKCRRILRQRGVRFDDASDSDGQLFLWGGECGRGAHTPVILLADAWVFDEASKEWCRCEGGGGGGPAPEAQSGVSAVFVDGHVTIPFPHRSELFFFNPRTRLWSRRLFRFHSTRDNRRSTTPQTGTLAVTPASSYATEPTHPPVLPVWVRPLDEVSSCSSASVMRLPGRSQQAAPLQRSPPLTLTPTPTPAPADVFTPLADAPAAPYAAASSLQQAPPSLQAAGQLDAGTPACPRRQWSPPRARAGRDHTTLAAHSSRYDVATATPPPPVSHAAAAARRRPLPHAADGGFHGAAHAAPAHSAAPEAAAAAPGGGGGAAAGSSNPSTPHPTDRHPPVIGGGGGEHAAAAQPHPLAARPLSFPASEASPSQEAWARGRVATRGPAAAASLPHPGHVPVADTRPAAAAEAPARAGRLPPGVNSVRPRRTALSPPPPDCPSRRLVVDDAAEATEAASASAVALGGEAAVQRWGGEAAPQRPAGDDGGGAHPSAVLALAGPGAAASNQAVSNAGDEPPELSAAQEDASTLHAALDGRYTEIVFAVIRSMKDQLAWDAVKAEFRGMFPGLCGGDVLAAMDEALTAKEVGKCEGLLDAQGITL